MPKISMPHLIILLPGILGSVLKKDEKVIWGYSFSSIAGNILSGGNKMRQELALPEDPHEVDDLGDGVVATDLMSDLHLLPGFWKIDGYTKIVKAIQSRFKVTEGENFFTFPYDWRRDNRVAARKLNEQSRTWLQKWRDKSGNQDAKLILIAHSMGGLVCRFFLETNEYEGWKNTKALITFGTPYRGSLNALNVLANGLRKGPLDILDLSSLVREFTSVYQLLPIYPVYDPGDGNIVRIGEVSGIPNVNPSSAAKALNEFHKPIQDAVTNNKQNSQYVDNGYSIHPVVGLLQSTKQSARISNDGIELYNSLNGKDLSGDGTVPRVSAIPLELSSTPNAMYAATQHGSLQNADPILVQLEGVLSDFNIDLGAFRKGYRLALEIGDLFYSNESVTLRTNILTAKESDTDLTVTLWRSGTTQPIVKRLMTRIENHWQKTVFESLDPGEYRVEVSGEDVETAADAFVVADIKEGQE